MIDEEIVRKIQEMGREGVSVSSIGRQFGLSRFTVRKYLEDESNHHETEKAHSFIPKKKAVFVLNHRPSETLKSVIPVERPSQRVIEEREDVEVTELQVRKQKAMTELEKVIPQREHPLVVERKARFETKKLDLDEFKVDRELQALREAERRKARAEEEARLEREIEEEMLAEEQERVRQHQKWIQGWQDWALTQGVSWISIPADIKFRIKDVVGKVLMGRSEHESKWDIEELVRITTQSVLQPFLDKMRAEKKIRLIESWAIPKIEDYIRNEGLGKYLDEETKEKAREYVHSHFMKTLTGNELIIPSHQVTDLLNNFFKPIKEKIRGIQEEQEKQEREKREAEKKTFWEKMKKEREEENEKERMEELLQVGMNRFSWYLTIHRKELGAVNTQEQERGKRHLEMELKKEIEGTETDEEVERLVDDMLDDYFFE